MSSPVTPEFLAESRDYEARVFDEVSGSAPLAPQQILANVVVEIKRIHPVDDVLASISQPSKAGHNFLHSRGASESRFSDSVSPKKIPSRRQDQVGEEATAAPLTLLVEFGGRGKYVVDTGPIPSLRMANTTKE
jgi:hypothetical protein